MKTKTKIEKQIRRKTNSEIVQTIISSKKNENWFEVAKIISGPRRKRIVANLDEINKEIKDGETILIPGKILSKGYIDKKAKIIALDISESARAKLENAKINYSDILDEIKKNPEAKGIRIIK